MRLFLLLSCICVSGLGHARDRVVPEDFYDIIPGWATDFVHPRSIWDDPLGHWKLSALAHVPRIETPTLVIHSENDARTSVTDADQFYRALRMNRVPAELVRYEGEGHGLSRGGRPDRRVDRLRRIVAWFKRWL